MKRRIMKEFRIDEISAVDHPAQAPAVATIMKRGAKKELDEDDMPEDEESLSDEEREKRCEERKGAGYKKDQDDEGAPGASDSSNNSPGNSADSVGTVQKEGTMSDTNDQTVEKAVHDEAIAELTKRAERAEQIANLSDAHRGVFKSLSGDEAEAFLAMKAEERDAEVAKAADADPVVYETLDGVSYRKSDDSRLVALAKQADEERSARLAMEAERKQERLAKRAAELGNLPGDDDARLALVKAVDGLPEEQRSKVDEILKSANSGLAKAFERTGTSAVPQTTDAESKLDALAKRIQSEDPKLSFAKAYDTALKTDEGRALYAAMRANG